MKCETCVVYKQVISGDEPACCAWYLEHVVCGGNSINECPNYEKEG